MNSNHRFKIPQNSSNLHFRRKSSVSARQKLISQEDCLFCTRKLKENYYPKMVVKALYSKFASSQNYYYTRDINDILANNRTRAVISHKDLIAYLEEDEEYLKRYYQIHENSFKMKLLVEYYKFHHDIPRLYMTPTCEVLNRYHDKKRRIDYVRIKKMLREQEKQENKSIVSDTGDIQGSLNSNLEFEKNNEPKMYAPIGNVLEGVDLEMKEDVPKSVQLARLVNQQKNIEVSNSYSLLDLNRNFVDVTEMKSELFEENAKTNFHDLSNFLNFMKINKIKKRNLDELSEIEKETNNSGFCYIHLPEKEANKQKIKEELEKNKVKSNKDLFAGAKRLDLSKLKKIEENSNKKENEQRPLSSTRKKEVVTKKQGSKPVSPNIWQIQSNTVREEIKTQRNEINGIYSNNLNGLFKINSERVAYEKSKKNFVEIANEAANKIINKSQNMLNIKGTNNQIQNNKQTLNKLNHNRVNSLYCNANSNSKTQIKSNIKEGGSPQSFKKTVPKAQVTYNNFFKTKSSLKKEPSDEYNVIKKNLQPKPNSLPKKNTLQKISHKYTKSDPNILFPKMLSSHSNTNNNNVFSVKEALENKGKKIDHSKKLSMNLKNESDGMKKTPVNHLLPSNSNATVKNPQSSQFYTINQNNILNIYFGEEAKGKFFINKFF